MAKQGANVVYICSECDWKAYEYSHKCINCGREGTLFENPMAPEERMERDMGFAVFSQPPILVGDIKVDPLNRILTCFPEIDAALGGGFARQSATVLSGGEGSGKSTLALQVCEYVALQPGMKALFISLEENDRQIKQKCDRLGIGNVERLWIACEPNVMRIFEYCNNLQPDIVIIDSLQLVIDADRTFGVGSAQMSKVVTGKVTSFVKKAPFKPAVVFINQLTKSGAAAGTRFVEHIVDTTIHMQLDEDTGLREFRVKKNRQGPSEQLVLLRMTEFGLVAAPKHDMQRLITFKRSPGYCKGVIDHEDYGIQLVDIQTVVTPKDTGKWVVEGYAVNRVKVILKVLESLFGIAFDYYDVTVKVVCRAKLKDVRPELDLAIAMSILSAVNAKPIPQWTLFHGELDVNGDIVANKAITQILVYAANLGFRYIYASPLLRLLNRGAAGAAEDGMVSYQHNVVMLAGDIFKVDTAQIAAARKAAAEAVEARTEDDETQGKRGKRGKRDENKNDTVSGAGA